MAKKGNNIKIKRVLQYQDTKDTYVIQLQRKRSYWWMFLLLLPFLLLIQCHKDITVKCIESETGLPVTEQQMTIEYNAHYLLKNWKFNLKEEVCVTQTTDEYGLTVFAQLPCSVYSYIFHFLNKAFFMVRQKCHYSEEISINFHFNRNVVIEMKPIREDLYIKLLDLETGDELPDAIISYEYEESDEIKTGSAHADASGVAVIPQMRLCSNMIKIRGSCYGYADTTKLNIPCEQLTVATDSEALRLRPIKERFTFFVKNSETKQPIPGALCKVSLVHPGASKQITTRNVTTSIDGKGIAIYENAFILSTIEIYASKIHYYDGKMESGPWVVEKFITQDEDTRTIWLKPEPYMQDFINIDSITNKPIAGVKNDITIVNATGVTEKLTEISNVNGAFSLKAKEDESIKIISTKNSEYKTKHTLYPKFKEIKDYERIIKLQPELVTLDFRTVRKDSWDLLPNCSIIVTGSISGILQPNNSNNGEFTVIMRKNELISIVASKDGFVTNQSKVKNAGYNQLLTQNDRDIPLAKSLEYDRALSADDIHPSYSETHCYDLYDAPASFSFNWSLCSACTKITITDSNGNTIAVLSSGSGSQRFTSSTQQICVSVTNDNGHAFEYHIRQ
ncbi:MAG: hypothetical protein II817_07465 [Bacteroidales bacterium]|nr:hypothetical protein [Bacteroidales bacterium]